MTQRVGRHMDCVAPHINDPAGGYSLGQYQEFALPSHLRGVAEAAWIYTSPPAAPAPPTHRVLPDTGVSLCVISHRDRHDRAAEPAVAVMGPIRTVRFFEPPPGIRMIGVRIKAECARWMLGVAPAELADVIDFGPHALRAPSVRTRLLRASDPRATLDALLHALDDRLAACPSTRAYLAVTQQLEDLRSRPFGKAAAPLRGARACVSDRQTRRLMRDLTGNGAKYFQRVRRLLHAVSQADATTSPRWSQIAADAGYYDQAHLTNEVREMTGVSPSRLHAERMEQWRGVASSLGG